MRALGTAVGLALALLSPLKAAERVTLYAGESKILAVESFRKMLVGNKDVVDVRTLSEDELLLNGKQAGLTSLTVWDRAGQKKAFEVEVQAAGLRKVLIEVDVQVLEISDTADWDVGIDWSQVMEGQAGNAPLQAVEQATPPLLSFGTFSRGPLAIRLAMLVQKNKARIVAKPRLLTVSGGSAKFLSGGQVPVAQQDGQGRTNTQYKDYGVSLNIAPKSDDEGNVSADVRAELSDIDAANSVSIGNGVLPAVKTRWVETTIFVKKGGTLVIAGLLQETEGKVTIGVPVLSEIPLLGELFKHTEFQRKNNELVIFVTPRVLGL
jgi:pilus assembly protein CpaC